MSTYILEGKVINCVITFAAQHNLISKEDRQAWADCFQEANYEAYNEHYNENIAFRPEFATAAQIMKYCTEIDCQSVDCSDWKNGDEVKLLRQIYLVAKKLDKAEQQLAKETAAANAQRWKAVGLQWLQQNRPDWGDYAIIAELMVNTSDIQTDYFACHSTATRFLVWSKHGRKLFAEMRKAAAAWPETAHLGIGRGLFKIMELSDPAEPMAHARIWANPNGQSRFDTHSEAKAEAETYAAEDAANDQKLVTGEIRHYTPNFPFGYEVEGGEVAIEHRENYSMGRGYYLAQDSYSGWQVRKVQLQGNLHQIAEAIGRQIEAETPTEEPEFEVLAIS